MLTRKLGVLLLIFATFLLISCASEPTGELVKIKEWSGTGIKKTEPFTINHSPWAISWANIPEDKLNIFQLYVYGVNNNFMDVAVNSMKNETDITYIYKTGTFYLQTNAIFTKWIIEVWAYQ